MWIQPIVFVPKLLELGAIGELTMYYFSYEIKQIHTTQFQSLLPKDYHMKHKRTIEIN
mgnify:CR=1 FL=1